MFQVTSHLTGSLKEIVYSLKNRNVIEGIKHQIYPIQTEITVKCIQITVGLKCMKQFVIFEIYLEFISLLFDVFC
jgi:hypothetical protein